MRFAAVAVSASLSSHPLAKEAEERERAVELRPCSATGNHQLKGKRLRARWSAAELSCSDNAASSSVSNITTSLVFARSYHLHG